jgi:hypothetical protein
MTTARLLNMFRKTAEKAIEIRRREALRNAADLPKIPYFTDV